MTKRNQTNRIPVPFRLRTVQDVEALAFSSPRPRNTELLAFARSNEVPVPPILSKLPESISLSVSGTRRRVRKVVEDMDLAYDENGPVDIVLEARGDILDVALDAPENYFEMVSRQVAECRAFLDRPAPVREWPENEVLKRAVELLSDKSELYGVLAELLRRYLETRDGLLRDLLRRKVLLLLIYQKTTFGLDNAMLERVRTLGERSALLLNELKRVLVDRLSAEKLHLFAPCLHAYVDISKARIIRIKAPAFFKQNLMVLMDEFAGHRDRRRAMEKWGKLVDTYGERTGEAEFRKMKSHLDNFLSKVKGFNDFFDVTLRSDAIRKLHRGYGRYTVRTVVTEEAVPAGVELGLHFCKDYHELLKGYYSADCTAGGALAENHVLNRRFFNVRIFREERERWVGNVYCLDYSDRGCVVIDRIQLSSAEELMPMGFFPKFMEALLEGFTGTGDSGSLTVLGAQKISNYTRIQDEYLSYTRNLPRVTFQFDEDDTIFECTKHFCLFQLSRGSKLSRESESSKAVD